MLCGARRAFTLLETVAVFVVLAVISGLVVASMSGVWGRTQDTAAQQAAVAVAGAQETSWRTYGTFATVGELAGRESAYTYVLGSTPSEGPTSISVHVAPNVVPGEEVVGIAVKGESGTCYLVKQYQPRAPRTLKNAKASSESGPCTGEAAMTATGEKF